MFRRRRVVASLVVVVAAGGAALGLALSGGPSATPTFTAAPASYVVVYRNLINGIAQWEVLAANRPFTGSDLTYRTSTRPTADAAPDAGTISTANGLYTESANGVRLVSMRQPGPASNDLWLSVEMQDAIARGLAVDLHQSKHIAGMSCSLFRFADPPSGPLHPIDLSVGHDDICLAHNGLLLSEAWTYHDSVVEQRTAVTVALGGWPADVPRPGSTADAAPASASAAVTTPEPTPNSFIATPSAPTGFRTAMTPVAFRLPDSNHPDQTVAATDVWAFADGADVITVEAGRERGGVLPWSDSDTQITRIRLQGLGAASTALRSDGPEVRIDVGAGRWVRVRGTVPLSTLVKYAGTLRLA